MTSNDVTASIRELSTTLGRRLAATDRGWRATVLGLGIALGAAVLTP